MANLLGGAALYDVIFGSLATLLAAVFTRWLKNRGASKWLAPLPAVVFNALIVGALMHLVYSPPEEVPYLAGVPYVGVGQAIACYILGMPLFRVLERYEEKLFRLR